MMISGVKMTVDKQIRTIAEFRYIPADNDNEEKMIIEGKAVSFESPTVLYEIDGVKYYEKISRNAFDGCDLKDTCLKYNHDDSTPILARVRGGSLKLDIREDGLYFRAELFNTSFSRDCFELIKQDALQCSFAFIIAEEEYDRETRTRTIKRIKKLIDLAIVSLPAYNDTFVKQARSFFELEREKELVETRNQLELARAKYFYFTKIGGKE